MPDCCSKLLSEGLDLCVRARRLDAQDRTNGLVEASVGGLDLDRYAPRHNAISPDQPVLSRSATIPLWVQDQYERDLADWERRAKHHLTQGCPQ
jgi:hypothetical protein